MSSISVERPAVARNTSVAAAAGSGPVWWMRDI